MNLIEAVKTGKWFKRKNDDTWLCFRQDWSLKNDEYRVTQDSLVFANISVRRLDCDHPIFSSLDILAKDWEVKEN